MRANQRRQEPGEEEGENMTRRSITLGLIGFVGGGGMLSWCLGIGGGGVKVLVGCWHTQPKKGGQRLTRALEKALALIQEIFEKYFEQQDEVISGYGVRR